MSRADSILFKGILIIACAVILYNEFLGYSLNFLSWHNLKCDTLNQSYCVRILLVADPQLLGEDTTDVIQRWDCDRYLSKTYSHAVAHAKPDIVVFLGDLMDEGSIATNDQHRRYFTRFINIYNTGDPIQHIWIPGDNDIGGDSDKLTKHKIVRYESIFQQPDVIEHRNIIFYKVNRITYEIPSTISNEKPNVNIALSHIPLLFMPATYVDKVVDAIQPSLLFSGHEHKSLLIDTFFITQEDRHIIPVLQAENQIYNLPINGERMYEIIVPTCSYRMGEPAMGFGFAVVDAFEKNAKYTVLWLPDRFKMLWTYVYTLYTVVNVIVLYLFFKIVTKLRRCGRSFRNRFRKRSGSCSI